MPTAKKLIEDLKKKYSANPNAMIVVGVWGVEEIKIRAKKNNIVLSNEEVEEVLEDLQDDFSTSIGINDEVIDEAISWHSNGVDDDDGDEEEMSSESEYD